MNKSIFFTDLDNTLLYSAKHKRSSDICVEWIKGKEQGYMPCSVYSNLPEIMKRIEVIPVTTRSVEQYRRIQWPTVKPRYAVTTNGAILLYNDKEDENWKKQSLDLIADYEQELYRLYEELKDDIRFIRCRIVDGSYLFTYCASDIDPKPIVEFYSKITDLNVCFVGKKIYFLPPCFNKGKAVERLVERFAPETLIGAGDGDMDISMLRLCNLSIVPDQIHESVTSGNTHVCPKELSFPQFVVDEISKYLSII